jgi:hypothetical protein
LNLSGYAQQKKIEVMTLGSFHFNFPNLDVKQTLKEDQIDVLAPSYQEEIASNVEKIKKFRPTVIAIERSPDQQKLIDSLFNMYMAGKYSLGRGEDKQIGFRLAKLLQLKKLYCVDEWGQFNTKLNGVVFGTDSIESEKFAAYFNTHPDSAKRTTAKQVFKTDGILAALCQANDEANVKKSLGNYLIGMFKYESQPRDFMGGDFETGRWFNRNLKIFRNIQRIPTGPEDRILLIIGADHLNLLNYLFESSPEYRLVKTNQYLR